MIPIRVGQSFRVGKENTDGSGVPGSSARLAQVVCACVLHRCVALV